MCQITSSFSKNSQAVEGAVLFVATTAIALLVVYLLKNPSLTGIPSFVCGYTLTAAAVALFALGVAKVVKNFLDKTI